MKIRTTDRLFYRSFPYKAVLNNDWAFAATHFTMNDIALIKSGKLGDYGRVQRAANRYPTEIIELVKILKK